MKKIAFKISSILLIIFFSVSIGFAQTKEIPVKKTEKVSNIELSIQSSTASLPCDRHNILNMSQLVNEMNELQECGGIKACTGSSVFAEFEEKTFTMLDHPNHGNNNQGFNVSFQNNLLQQTKGKANEEAPTCGGDVKKSIYKLVFSYEVDNTFNGIRYLTHVTVTYACCSGKKDN